MMVLATMSCLSMSNASLSEQECRDLGFERSQLSCESCDVLNERIQDDVLSGECRSCCTETAKGNLVRFQKMLLCKNLILNLKNNSSSEAPSSKCADES